MDKFFHFVVYLFMLLQCTEPVQLCSFHGAVSFTTLSTFEGYEQSGPHVWGIGLPNLTISVNTSQIPCLQAAFQVDLIFVTNTANYTCTVMMKSGSCETFYGSCSNVACLYTSNHYWFTVIINDLGLDYNRSKLYMIPFDLPSITWDYVPTEIFLKECPPTHENSWDQIITFSPSPAPYNTSAQCICKEGDEYYSDGSISDDNATCSALAAWDGCADVQCWFAATNVTVHQGNMYANHSAGFSCTYKDGFPNYTSILYYIGNKLVSESEDLQSSDHGETFFCKVQSEYTLQSGNASEGKSKNDILIVFFAPEKNDSTENVIFIGVKGSQEIFVFFRANDKNDNVTFTFTKDDNERPTNLSNLNNDTDTYYNFTYTITINSSDDYGSYLFNAYTTDPRGKLPVNITVVDSASKVPTTTTSPPVTTTPYGSSTDGPGGLSTGAIAGISAAAAAIVILIIIVVILRRKRTKEVVEKEERVNPIYGESVAGGSGGNEKEERINPLYGSADPTAGVSEATYSTVDKSQAKKKKPKTEKEEKINPLYNPATGNPDSVDEAYAEVDRRKKNKKGGAENHGFTVEATGDTYAEVNKPKKKKPAAPLPDVTYAEVQKDRKKKKDPTQDGGLHGSANY